MIGSIAIAMFMLAAVFALVRLVRGPALVDRVISRDVMLVALMCAVATRAAATGDQTYLGVLAVIAIVAFTATVVLSRFVERNEAGGRS